ncbi:MAG: AbrB/MazE/SpoVT family DNA-binding domain-containing protein [Eubacteriales bacterium]|nr:AbrB/MazE/SpoVT family DNA-binding domain-containing protein [Eubacteriales bacterium]
MITTLRKWGNSVGIRIPKTILQSMECTENEDVELLLVQEGLLIRKVEKRGKRSVREGFAEEAAEFQMEN